MAKEHDKQFKLDAVQYYQDHKDLGVRGCAENLGIEFTVIATLCYQMNSSEYIKKERPFSLEVFRHTGHSGHLLFAAELPICSRNAETPKTVSRCMVSGRFWAFSFDMSGFVLAAVSFTANHSKAAVCRFRVTKKRRIATTLLSCSEDGARKRYSIICYAFSFCWQPLYQWQHRR